MPFHLLRLPRKMELRVHQILRLPRKMEQFEAPRIDYETANCNAFCDFQGELLSAKIEVLPMRRRKSPRWNLTLRSVFGDSYKKVKIITLEMCLKKSIVFMVLLTRPTLRFPLLSHACDEKRA